MLPTAQILQLPAVQRLLEKMEDVIRAAPPTTAYNKTALLDSYQEALQDAAVSYPNLLTAAQSPVMSPDEAPQGGNASVPAPAATQVKLPLFSQPVEVSRWHRYSRDVAVVHCKHHRNSFNALLSAGLAKTAPQAAESTKERLFSRMM